MSALRQTITSAIGPRASVRLARKLGGASLYVAQATPNYAEITNQEREQICALHQQGYFNREIAAIMGRSVSSIGPILSVASRHGRFRGLPKAQTFEGRVLRDRLRKGDQSGRTYKAFDHPRLHPTKRWNVAFYGPGDNCFRGTGQYPAFSTREEAIRAGEQWIDTGDTSEWPLPEPPEAGTLRP